MSPKCSRLIAIAAFAAAGTLASPAGAATTGSGAHLNLNLSPAVKTATTLSYLGGAASLIAPVGVDADEDHVHKHGVLPPGTAQLSAEGSFTA